MQIYDKFCQQNLMKKIKSKLVYINPCPKSAQRQAKSPSPDTKNKSKIQKTASPAKQVQNYYKIKSTIGSYCTQQKKQKIPQIESKNKQSKLLSISLNDSHQEIDFNDVAQSIKLKSPSSFYHLSLHEHSSKKQHQISYINQQQYFTPKSKNTFQNGFFQPSTDFNHNYYQSHNKFNTNSFNTDSSNKDILLKQGSYQSKKLPEKQKSQFSPNKKSKKKLQVYSPLMNSSSKQKPTKDSSSKINESHRISQESQFNSQRPYRSLTQQMGKSQQDKETIIFYLQEKLRQKDQQIQKMSLYVKQYEKLGIKNKKLEKEMKEILDKLIEMKQKEQASLSVSRQSQSHNQFSQEDKSGPQNQQVSSSTVSEQSKISEIQLENKHRFHKKSLTDDYIKIYDDLHASSQLNIEEQEQSYKPNFMNYSEDVKPKQQSSPSSHRKILSVGARLKQSLNAKNQNFKASFDDSILLSSSSSQFLSNPMKSPKQSETKNFDFSKKLQRVKTQETQEGPISLKQLQSYRQQESFISDKDNLDLNSQKVNPKTQKIEKSLSEDSQIKEQTTVKKSKVRYAIKKRDELNVFSQKNYDTLVETNKKLTSIIENLMKSHDSMFQQVKRMSEKNEVYANKMIQIQEQFNQIRLNFNQLSAVSYQILNSINKNFSSSFSFKSALTTIEQKVNKLYDSINENTKEIKRVNSQKQNQNQATTYLSKINSFGKQTENQKENKRLRKQSGSEFKQVASPSFTYLQEGASFLTESFRLSHSERSNPSNSRFNYCSTVEDQMSQRKFKNSQSNSGSQKSLRYEQKSKILIREDGSSEQNLFSHPSNGTSQFIQIDSGRGVSQRQKSTTSKDKMKSENSEIRINFDDLYDDTSCQRPNLVLIESQSEVKCSQGRINQSNREQSVILMKSSFGPIIQKQMSISEKGDSMTGEIQDQVHGVDFLRGSPQKQMNRPRQNSSINIFFSSESICKSNIKPSNPLNEQSMYRPKEFNSSSDDNSWRSARCSDCQSKDELIRGFQIQASKMRTLISELSEQKDKLQKLVKSKVSIIDNLQVSLKQLQSLSSLQLIKQKKQTQISKEKVNIENNFLQRQNKEIKKSPILFNLQPVKCTPQIQDLLPISKYLQNQLSSDKVQTLKQIQLQIQKQLLKQHEIQQQLMQTYLKEKANTLNWAQGSFSQVQEFREESFVKTKAILIKLISLIRNFIAQGNHNLNK